MLSIQQSVVSRQALKFIEINAFDNVACFSFNFDRNYCTRNTNALSLDGCVCVCVSDSEDEKQPQQVIQSQNWKERRRRFNKKLTLPLFIERKATIYLSLNDFWIFSFFFRYIVLLLLMRNIYKRFFDAAILIFNVMQIANVQNLAMKQFVYYTFSFYLFHDKIIIKLVICCSINLKIWIQLYLGKLSQNLLRSNFLF